jgi:beta-N-acetylhexosaminidase
MSTLNDVGAISPGALVMVDIRGRALDAEQADFLSRHRIRAVCLFRANLGSEDEVRQLTSRLREVMGPRALIGIDQEGGSVVRATFLPHPPAAMALGAAGDADLAHRVGTAVGRGLRSVGINWNFAPVLDVNNNPDNPVIAERSFGADPREVARLAGPWMLGAMEAGVACCCKHFPGHGDTSVDSHHDLPVVDKALDVLQALELAPFHALRKRAPAFMSAHILYPQLDPDLPATLSRPILGALLREDWGYDGVVITDSLVMRAITQRFGHERSAVLALQAGADMAMAFGSREEQSAALDGIAAAMEHQALAPATMARAVARIDALAARFAAEELPYSERQREMDERTMREAWTRALTRIGAATPPPRHARLRVLAQRQVPGDAVAEAGLAGERVARLFAHFTDAQIMLVDDLPSLRWEQLPADGRTCVLVSNVRVRYGEAAHAWRPHLHIALWNPFQVCDVAAPALVSWGYAEAALEAVQAWLHGQLDAVGRPPVPLTPGSALAQSAAPASQ